MRRVQTPGALGPTSPFWLVLLALANGLDILTTAIGLRLGIPEDNPVMHAILRSHGELAMYSFKVLLVASIVYAIFLLRARFRRSWVLLLALILLPSLIVVNNLLLIAHVRA